jgi:hypothetical protein
MIETGDFFLSQNKTTLLNKLIMFFSSSIYTHCGIVFFKQDGMLSVLEAGNTVQVVPWFRNYIDQPKEKYVVFRINRDFLPGNTMNFMISSVWYNHSGKWYGHLQLLWHIWRYINEKFGRDIRKKKNWFKGGYICTEILYLMLREIKHDGVREFLNKFDSNNINCEDIKILTKLFPEVFNVIERRGL